MVGGGLHVAREDGAAFFWAFDDLRRVDSLGPEALRIQHSRTTAETLTVTETGLVESVRAISPEAAGKLESRRRFDGSARATALKVGVGAVVAAAIYFLLLPALASIIAARVPPSWEEQLGRNVLETAAPLERRCGSPVTQMAFEKIVSRLMRSAGPVPYQFSVTLVDDSVLNAFAAPGGFIVVNRGLLEATQTPEEMAGVLAHEIQHVIRHHVTRGIIREVPLRIVVSSIAGGADAIGAAASRAVGTLGALRFRREDEAEADREGMRMLQAAGIDSRGMISFFQTLSMRQGSESRVVAYLSTHPQTSERLAVLGRLARLSTVQPEPIDLEAPWQQIKTTCSHRTA